MKEFAFETKKRQRRLYLVIGVILLLFLGLIYAWSVFRIPLEQEFGWSKAETSVTFSISMIMFCLGGVVSGILTEKKGHHFTLFGCAAFLAAGFLGASQIDSLMGIYTTYGVLCGFGVGLGYNAVISTIVKWYPDQQGLVSGIALMGFGLGGMVLGTLGARLIMLLGWRLTFVIFAAAFGLVFVLGALLLRSVTAAFLKELASSSRNVVISIEEVDYRDMLRRRNFWLYFFYAFILSAAGLAILNISANYASDMLQSNLAEAAAIAGVISITNGLGRIVSGKLFDSKGYRTTMIFICLIFAIAAGLLLFSEASRNMWVLIGAFIFVGLGYGGVPPINSAFTAKFFGSQHYPLNYSITNLCILPASIVGPTCANGSYLMTFMVVLTFAVIAFLIMLGIQQPVARGGEKSECI